MDDAMKTRQTLAGYQKKIARLERQIALLRKARQAEDFSSVIPTTTINSGPDYTAIYGGTTYNTNRRVDDDL
jgi:hypothetical protein